MVRRRAWSSFQLPNSDSGKNRETQTYWPCSWLVTVVGVGLANSHNDAQGTRADTPASFVVLLHGQCSAVQSSHCIHRRDPAPTSHHAWTLEPRRPFHTDTHHAQPQLHQTAYPSPTIAIANTNPVQGKESCPPSLPTVLLRAYRSRLDAPLHLACKFSSSRLHSCTRYWGAAPADC